MSWSDGYDAGWAAAQDFFTGASVGGIEATETAEWDEFFEERQEGRNG